MAKPPVRRRPRNQDDFFAMEVHRVMSAYGCGVRAACIRIARGMDRDKVPLPSGQKPGRYRDGRVATHTLGSPWKGQNAKTLETRYFRWLKREDERQKTLTVKIPNPLF
jgi:hypothetical protein